MIAELVAKPGVPIRSRTSHPFGGSQMWVHHIAHWRHIPQHVTKEAKRVHLFSWM